MKICIDTDDFPQNISLEEILVMFGIYYEAFNHDTLWKTFHSGNVVMLGNKFPDILANIQLTAQGKALLESIINKPQPVESFPTSRYEKLAVEMMALFPTGNMPNTNYKWKCNKSTVVAKLKSFTKKFGTYSDEQILDATKRYVEDYAKQGYKYMQLLKYFIWKDDDNNGLDSQLATYIENKDAEASYNPDWNVNLVC